MAEGFKYITDQERQRQTNTAGDSPVTTGVPADPWFHRSDGMRCKTCIYFAPKPPRAPKVEGGYYDIGRCRRHAPTMSGYPVVFVNDWCGDHKIDEGKL